MNTWTWKYEAADGSELTKPELPRTMYPSQADAETWIGESWRALADLGVEQVYLLDGDQTVYGPMSLRPSE